jgi:hypothetical protein
MHLPINIKSPNNISKWQMGFNSAFKGLICLGVSDTSPEDGNKYLTECRIAVAMIEKVLLTL